VWQQPLPAVEASYDMPDIWLISRSRPVL
jgi:hypothetical protein